MINIVNGYPDFLNLYGEYAAVKLLDLRLRDCSQEVRIQEMGFGRYADLSKADLIYFGAGTEDRMLAVLADLRGYKNDINLCLERGGVIVASGSSMALFCSSITDERTARKFEGLGLFDADAVITKKRRYGELVCEYEDGKRVIGAVNSSIDFTRRPGQGEMFKVIWDSSGRFPAGSGEGMKSGNVYASEITGPLVCRNPHMLDMLAEKIAGEKLPEMKDRWYREALAAYDHAYGILVSEGHIKNK